jgi:single-strand DNA-binding protein|tara:strand:- start:474 stop:854 length:381 start_codon:yes stop_codon:yes gene_type:complete
MLKITAIGNVTRDNELREVNGTKVLNFSIARNDRRTKQVTYIECTLWGALAVNLSPFLNKGTKVYVDGELSMREYNGKSSLNCRVQDIELVGGRPQMDEGQQQMAQYQKPETQNHQQQDLDDEIPF